MDLIIGAGVSGISYANFTRDDFLIVERDATPGGYCRTTKRNGYVWDYSGHFSISDILISKDMYAKILRRNLW